MVTINVAVEDGGGYIHLISSEQVRPLDLEKDHLEAQCGFIFDEETNLCDARDTGHVTFRGQPFDPDDLADLILRLRRDGYMCRECVREHFKAVGGIPGLYHDRWTEDLHRETVIEDGDGLKPVHATVTLEEGVDVMRVGDGDVMVNGECPTCEDPLIALSEGGESVAVMCPRCSWGKAVDLPR